MKRRDALKNIGLTIGYGMAAPSLLQLLQSCQQEIEPWIPEFLSHDEGVILENLVNLILPKTDDTPGALDVNVPKFIDLVLSKGTLEEQQLEIKEGFSEITKALNIPEAGVSELKTKDYDALLAKYFKVDKAQIEKFEDNEVDKLIFDTLKHIRSQSIWAFKSTKSIGKEVLAYDPIPGNAIGCISVQDATGGKAWTL